MWPSILNKLYLAGDNHVPAATFVTQESLDNITRRSVAVWSMKDDVMAAGAGLFETSHPSISFPYHTLGVVHASGFSWRVKRPEYELIADKVQAYLIHRVVNLGDFPVVMYDASKTTPYFRDFSGGAHGAPDIAKAEQVDFTGDN